MDRIFFDLIDVINRHQCSKSFDALVKDKQWTSSCDWRNLWQSTSIF